MENVWILIFLVVGLYYLKRWLAQKVMQHPELQMIDALDRILHGMIVLVMVWFIVTVFGNWLSGSLFWHGGPGG